MMQIYHYFTACRKTGTATKYIVHNPTCEKDTYLLKS
jgi:hypothetical protein